MKKILLPLLCLGLALASASAGVISVSAPLTTDASTGISAANTYTHAISGGSAATVNGVNFVLLSSAVTPANFTWVSNNAGNKAEVVNNPGDWVAATGGVTGPGLISLLNSFTYAPQGAQPGNSQTFTLSGLILGTTYDARLYIRTWDTEASGRPIDLRFTHGAEVNTAPTSPEDRPGTVLGTNNQHQAFYVNYRYTALATTLVIDATVAAAGGVDSGSFHLYALSNQVIPEPSTAAALALALGLFGGARRRRS
jgi:hypothetical protein